MHTKTVPLEIPIKGGLAARLTAAAAQKGLTLEELAAEIIRTALAASQDAPPPDDPGGNQDRGKSQAAALRREVRWDNHRSHAYRAHLRSKQHLAVLPFPRVRWTVLRRLWDAKRPPSELDQEDVHSAVMLACSALGLAEGCPIQSEQWKEIFRMVRNELGTDRTRKRAEIAQTISLNPRLLEMLNVPSPAVTAPQRSSLACELWSLHRILLAAFRCDPSRKRRANFRAAVAYVRGAIGAVPAKASSDSAPRVALHQFRAYIRMGMTALATT